MQLQRNTGLLLLPGLLPLDGFLLFSGILPFSGLLPTTDGFLPLSGLLPTTAGLAKGWLLRDTSRCAAPELSPLCDARFVNYDGTLKEP